MAALKGIERSVVSGRSLVDRMIWRDKDMKDIGPARLLLPLLSFYRSYFPHHPKIFPHHPEIFSLASSNIFLIILKYFPHHPQIFFSQSSNIFLIVLKYFPHSPQIFSSTSSNTSLNILKYFPHQPQIFSSSSSHSILGSSLTEDLDTNCGELFVPC